MPRYSGILAFICLVSICVGINIIRYPVVADMLTGEHVNAKNKDLSGKDEISKDSQSQNESSTSSYRSYSSGESDKKSSSYGNKPISSNDGYSGSSSSGKGDSSTSGSYGKSSYSSSGSPSSSSSSSSYGGYSSGGSSSNKDSGSSTGKNDSSTSDSYGKSSYESKGDVSQNTPYQSGMINPGYASHYSSESSSADTTPKGQTSGSMLSAAQRFEQQKQQPFTVVNRETRESASEASYYIPPSFSANGSSLAVPALPSSKTTSFEPIPLPPVEQE